MKDSFILFLQWYLPQLAKAILSIYKPLVIGVTGSVGKTTTKEAIAHLLKTANLAVLKTEGNLNTDIGISLTVLGFNHSPAIWEWPYALIVAHIRWFLLMARVLHLPPYFVVELGVDRLGDMKRMTSLITPNIGVITWIGEGHHLEFLRDGPTTAQEKGQMLTVLPDDGLALIPSADPHKKILLDLAAAPVVEFTATGVDSVPQIVRIIGAHLQIEKKIIEQAIATFKQPKGRLNEFPGINNSIILDDSYNMSLPAAKEALRILAQKKAKRKVAILGDMLEQGTYEKAFHREIADLAKIQADLFIAVGKRMRAIKSDYWFSSPDEAAEMVPQLIGEGDLVLVKGSQGMRMEKLSLALAKDKDFAAQLLPRQSTRWRQIPFENP